MLKFKTLASIAMERWSLDDCRFVYSKSSPNTVERKVALWAAKKKFSFDLCKQTTIEVGQLNLPIKA